MSGETGKNEATNTPAEGEIVQQGSNVEATKRVAKSLFDRKCSNCGKKSKLTLGQMRMAKNGRLITRCCRSKFITPEQVDRKQEAAANKKLQAREAALPVTEAMVRALLVGTGMKIERHQSPAPPGGKKPPQGWAISGEKSYGVFILIHSFRTLGQAYIHARKQLYLPTDIDLVEKELRGDQ